MTTRSAHSPTTAGDADLVVRADGGDIEPVRAPGAHPRRHALHQTLQRSRAWIADHPRLQIFYRVAVAIFGGILTLVGLVLVPLPGPGWLTVFLGLAVLGTEFHWARRLARWAKRMLDRFWAWWRARRERSAGG
ncbi:hypothetical protein GCM10009808_09780 [Microbacterium sediminicola]|uniref:TIGR02611 family protein n=1 Tax=Microbacterium sediminicola TaxID=415210 RepID=A0ABP4TXJ8_9MICO